MRAEGGGGEGTNKELNEQGTLQAYQCEIQALPTPLAALPNAVTEEQLLHAPLKALSLQMMTG